MGALTLRVPDESTLLPKDLGGRGEIIEWREWRCGHCGAYINEYNAAVAVHMRRRCPKCKTRNELDRRNRVTLRVVVDELREQSEPLDNGQDIP